MKKQLQKILFLSVLLALFALKANAQCAPPTALLLNSLTQNTADVAWVVSNEGVNSGVYKLKVSTIAIINPNTQTGDVYDDIVNGAFQTIQGLQPNTTYYVSVATDCSGTQQGSSQWLLNSTFTTPCTAQAVPLVANFDAAAALPSCWLIAGTNTAAPPQTVTTPHVGASGRAVKLTGTTTADTYLISPAINAPADNLEVSFKAYGAAGTDVKVGILTDVADISGVLPVYDNVAIINANTWEEHFATTTTSYESGSGYYVVFYLESGKNQTVYIDDIDIHIKPTCPRPQQAVYSNITANSVLLNWTETGTATNWTVQYINLATSDTNTVVANTKPFTLNGLSANTDYKISIAANCGSGYSSFITIKTECEVYTLPYVEDFNSYSTGISTSTSTPTSYPNHTLPDCWKFLNLATTSSTYPQAFLTSYSTWAVSGNSLFFKSSDTTPAFAVLPAFNVRTDSLRVRFTYRNEGTTTSNGILSLGYLTNPNDAATFTQLEEFPRLTAFTAVDLTLDAYSNVPQNARLAFKYTGGTANNYYLSIDNITISRVPTCTVVKNITLSNLTRSTADLSWTPQGTETAWELTLTRILGTDTVTSVHTVSGQPAYQITGLAENSAYKITASVKAICSPTDYSEAVSQTFNIRTDCDGLLALPYFESFETYPSDFASKPACWQIIENYVGNYVPKAWVSNGWATLVSSGTKSLIFATTRDNPSVALLPKFNAPFNDLYIAFDRKDLGIDGSKLTLGAIPAGADTSAFIPIVDLPETTTFTRFEYALSNANLPDGVNYRIALKFDGGSGENSSTISYTGIDSIMVDYTPTCFKPASLALGNITNATVEIIITDTIASAWDIAYLPTSAAFNPDTVAFVTVNNDTALISGLQETTTYTVYVRANCGNGDVSWWQGPISFTTAQTPTPMPYISGFENADDNAKWLLLNGSQTNKWFIGTAATAVKDGSRALYISNTSATTGTYNYSINNTSYVWATRTFNFDEGEVYNISFDWKANGESTYDLLRAFLVPVSVQLASGDAKGMTSSTNTNPAGWIDLTGGKLNLQTAWQSVSTELRITDGGFYNLVFFWKNDGGVGTQPPAAIDNVSVYKVTCIKPYDFILNAVTTDSASVSWQAGDADGYQVQLSDTAVISTFAVTSKTATFSNLQPNTQYTVKVRTICGTDTTVWSVPYIFRTECTPLVLPYTERFEANDPTSQMDCWRLTKTAETGAYAFSTSYKYEGNRSFYARSVTAISPRLDVESLANYQTSGFARGSADSAYLSIGVMTDPSDIGTFEPIKTVLLTPGSTWIEFKADFSILATEDYAGYDPKYIAYYFSNTNKDVYIDLLTIEEIPTCPKPDDIAVSGFTATDATFDWTPAGAETVWNLKVTQGTSVIIDSIATSHPVTISGLSANTAYTVSVAAICGAGDTSAFTLPLPFKTLCGVITLPYSENFESYTGTSNYYSSTAVTVPDCWSAFTNSTTYAVPHVGTYSYTSGNGSSNYLVFVNNANYSYAVLPPLEEGYTDAKLSFWAEWESTSYGVLQLGYVDNTVSAYADCAASFDTLAVYTPSDAGAEYHTNLGALDIPTGKRLAFRFFQSSGTFFGMIVDNITLEMPAPCEKPTGLTVANDTVISWTAGTATAWNVVVSATAITDFSNVTLTPVTAATYTATGLTPEITYFVYVQTDCGDGVTSEWISTTVFIPRYCIPHPASVDGQGITNVTFGYQQIVNNTTGAETGTYGRYAHLVGDIQRGTELEVAITYSTGYTYGTKIYVDWNNNFDFTDDGENVYTGESTNANPTTLHAIFTVPLSTPLGVYRMRIVGSDSGDNNPCYSDSWGSVEDYSLQVLAEPSCLKPTSVTVFDITANTAKVTWAHGAEAVNYEIVLLPAGTPFSANGVIVAATDTFELTGLTSATSYDVYVRTKCTETEYSDWSNVAKFKTLCEALPVPYTQNFDSYTEGVSTSTSVPAGYPNHTLPDCWKFTNMALTSGYDDASYPRAFITSYEYFDISGNALYLQNSRITPLYAALPEFNVPLDTLKFTFEYKNASTGTAYPQLVFGVMTDPTNAATFTTIEALEQVTEFTAKAYYFKSLTLPADARYLAFKYVGGTLNGTGAAIDNISLTILPLCFAPEDIQVSAITATNATFTWAAGVASTSYQVAVAGDTIDTANSSLTVTTLLPNTAYTVKVRAICGTDTTAWSAPVGFRTSTVPAALPYVHGFENATENTNWQLLNGDQTSFWTIGSGDATAVESGSNALYITNNGATNAYSTTSYVWATRSFEFAEDIYNIAFSWKANGESTWDLLRAFLVPANVQLAAGNAQGMTGSTNTNPAGWIALDEGKLNLQTSWQQVSKMINITSGGVYNLVFFWKNDGYGDNQPPAAIDNIVVERLTCITPFDLALSSVTTTTATLTWVAGVTSTSYQVRQGTNILNVPYNSALLEGLSPQTSYIVQVRAICGEDTTAWSTPYAFTTACNTLSLPYSENFNNYTGTAYSVAGVAPDCWNTYTDNTTYPAPHVGLGGTTYVYSPDNTNSLVFTAGVAGQNTYAILPLFEGDALSTAKVTFWARWENASGVLKLGYVTNPTDTSTFVPLETYTPTTVTAGATFTTSLAEYTIPANAYLAFYYRYNTSYYSLSIDNLRIACYDGVSIIQDTVCANLPYAANGFNIPASSLHAGLNTFTQEHTATSSIECDRTTTLELFVRNQIQTTFNDTICQGQSYSQHNFTNLTATGVYRQDLVTVSGCDSTVILNLFVRQLTATVNATVCEQTGYLFGGQTITASGTYTHTVANAAGCDSTTTLNLTVLPANTALNVRICQGQSYTFNGQTLTTSGTRSNTFANSLGCDSTVTLNLTVIPTNVTVSQSICAGSSYNFGGQTLTASGIYSHTFTNSLGCDSIVTLNLTVREPIVTNIARNVCNGALYYGDGFNGVGAGVHQRTVTASNGCDSTIVLTVTNVLTVHTTDAKTICQGETFVWGGNTYTTAGIYTATFVASTGCDSVVTLTLTVNPRKESTDVLSINRNQLPYNYNGYIIPSSQSEGQQTIDITFQTSLGCDSIVHLTLTVTTGLFNPSADLLKMYPNPVKRGASVNIEYEFTAAEKQGLVLEVFNSLGQRVYVTRPTEFEYPLTVKQFPTSGAYLIRITAGGGAVFNGRVLVED